MKRTTPTAQQAKRLRRAQNQFGALVWQLNEIWPTGGWGSVEYGSAVEGQVLGGRWKPLQYLYRQGVGQVRDVFCLGL